MGNGPSLHRWGPVGAGVYHVGKGFPRPNDEDTPLALTGVLMIVILCQAAFGAWTVTLKLWPQVVTGHLLGGFTTLSLIWLLYLRQGGASSVVQALPAPTMLAKVAFVAVVIQIMLGGWVSSNYAALACYDFPSCDGTFFPADGSAGRIQHFSKRRSKLLGRDNDK